MRAKLVLAAVFCVLFAALFFLLHINNAQTVSNVLKTDIPDADTPMIALTFDDGPAYDYDGYNSTARILDVLGEYGAKATFFMVGERINGGTQYLLERELELGCELGNHTFDHRHYGSEVTAYDISRTSDRIISRTGRAPTVFRCPGGSLTPVIRDECRVEGMPLAYWSVDTKDWKTQNAEAIYKTVMNSAYDGAIILMHDIYPSTAAAMEGIVPDLIDRGYRLVTVSELLRAKNGKPPSPGEQYSDAFTINNATK